MPILKSNKNKLTYFVHIPKCAGSSIENYVFQSNSHIAFLRRNNELDYKNLLNFSPQHTPAKFIEYLFDPSFFDNCFVVIRNPISRLKSAFYFLKECNTIEKKMDINFFVKEILPKNYMNIGWFDNHFYPQYLFLPTNTKYKLFLLENGIGAIKKYIDSEVLELNPLNIFFRKIKFHIKKIVGYSHYKSFEYDFPHSLKRNYTGCSELNNSSIAIVQDIYEKDFKIFNKELKILNQQTN